MMDDLPEPDPADDPDWRAARSMAAFDAMPQAYREFCADYARSADGTDLLMVLEECSWQVPRAINRLRSLLPVRS